jgi:hypothetical protein
MSLKVPDVGEIIILKALRAGTGLSNWFVLLYDNNYTPVDSSVYANFHEAVYTGYIAQAVNFGVPTTVSGKAKMVGTAQLNFTVTVSGSPNTIYGYLIGDTLSGEVVYAERFASSQVMQNAGDTIGITLAFTGSSEF